MGQQAVSKRERRGEIIHRTKLFGGVRTAEEINSKHGFGGKCDAPGKCPNAPVISVKMFMLHDEFVQRSPEMALAIVQTNPDGPFIPCVEMTFGPMVMFSKVNACRTHQRELEMTAAKAPSYVLVEFNRGPGADRPIVAVPR